MAKTISNPPLTPSESLYPSETLFPKGATYFENSQILHLFELELKTNTTVVIPPDGADNPNTTDAIPTMTSNTAPSGVASASAINSSTYDAWRAFDGTLTTRWLTPFGVTTGWLQYQFPSGKIINKYTLMPTTASRAPKTWTLKASNTGTFGGEEVILHSQSNITTWTNQLSKTFTFINSTEYSYFRVDVTENNGDASFLDIGEWQLIEAQPPTIETTTTTEILRFTDNELFATIDNETYMPISISFDEIREDFTLQADQVQTLVDNIDSQFTTEALTKEWRNNNGKIYRIVYNELPQSSQENLENAVLPSETLYPSESLKPKELEADFEVGIFSFDDGYPSINFDQDSYLNRFNKDLIFEGLIDDFKGGNGKATVTLTSVLSVWDAKTQETFDQGQWKNIIGAMTDELQWKP